MTRRRSPECKSGNHADCTGRIERMEWNMHDEACQCMCHVPADYLVKKHKDQSRGNEKGA